jgi:hypothetical protein
MPYPAEHSCRLVDPSEFSEFRRENAAREHDGKRYDVIWGKLKSTGSWAAQAYRYPAKVWSAEEAQAHCRRNKGLRFERASGEND